MKKELIELKLKMDNLILTKNQCKPYCQVILQFCHITIVKPFVLDFNQLFWTTKELILRGRKTDPIQKKKINLF